VSRSSLPAATVTVAAAAAVATIAFLVAGFAWAPIDAVQGPAQKLLYVHVPAAWAAYLAFATTFVASVGYLTTRRLSWDRGARASAELGVGLTALAIALGAIWAKPIWGVWWTWEPRLVTTAVLLLSYVGYLGVRGLSVDAHRNARRAAVVGIVAVANIPVVHFSVVWWRTLHQPPTVLRPEGPGGAMEGSMLAALLLALAAFTLASIWVFLRRIRLLAAAAARGSASDTVAGAAAPHGADTAETGGEPIVVRGSRP